MTFEVVKIKPYMPVSLFLVVTMAIVVILLDNANLDNAAYGQSLLFPNAQNSGLSSNPSPILHYQQPPSLANQQNQSNLHLVRITIPTKGQQVPVGKELFILGTSAGNASSGCKVSVKVNSINPYHEASPNSGAGRSDYSKWNFTLSPTYTAIKQGQNKITAKFACNNEPALVSHYSVNVTGVSTVSTTFSPNHQYLQPAVNSKAPTTTATTSTTATAAIHGSPSKPSPVNTNHHVSLVSLSIRIGKSSVHPGDTEIVSISAVDKNSSKPITGASVSGNISSSGLLKKFRGSTDNSGRASYSWKVSSGDTTGKYRVIAQVYSPDYESKSASKTFKVSPVPVIVSSPTYTNNNSLTSSSHVTNNDNNNNNNNNNNTSSAAHINNSKNKNRHQHTSNMNPVNNGNNNNSLTPSPHTPGSNTKKSNLATSNAAQINNSKNKNLHNPFSIINPNQRFGVPITHVPFVIP